MDRVRGELRGRKRAVLREEGLRCAAVLMPLLFKDGEWHVAVTQRTLDVEHHKGQISFPGGACEPQDADLLATALRETFEEIGVPPEAVEVLGPLDDFRTITHFAVTPFVGVIPYPFPYKVSPWEVADVVEVPLSFLCDDRNVRIEELEHEGHTYQVLFWDYQAYTIWGATARMLKGLLDLVCEAAED